MFNFLASQIPGPIFCTPASLGHTSITGMSIGNLQYILLHDIHNLLCDLILKHESTSPEFVWGFQCSLLGSKIHYLGQEKSNSLHGSTQVYSLLGSDSYLVSEQLFPIHAKTRPLMSRIEYEESMKFYTFLVSSTRKVYQYLKCQEVRTSI